jgi:predicted DNA-binding transcriptional regulator YafY
MRKSADTLRRLLAILHHLPHAPRKLSTAEIHRALLDLGFNVALRSIQRDLDQLSIDYPVTSERKDQKTSGTSETLVIYRGCHQ